MEKRRRSGNILVHGVPEEIPNLSSQAWVKNFINVLHTKVQVKRFSRVGLATAGKSRPILIFFGNGEEKRKIMENLSALKGKEDYNNVSIMEDLTMEERKSLKTLSNEAATRNNVEMSSD